jgi:hypothetical protein
MYFTNNHRLEILEARKSNTLGLRKVIALESISDALDDIYCKLDNINSKL